MKITKIIENKNGSADVVYELDAKEIDLFKYAAKIKHKKFSKKFINDSILKSLNNCVKEELKKLNIKEIE